MIYCRVILTKQALKDLHRVPKGISKKFFEWFDDVEDLGVSEVRKIKSYHDRPLQGERFGQRSIRLSRTYRAFYSENKKGEIQLIQVIEVNKHDY